jgi:hypothetical protein
VAEVFSELAEDVAVDLSPGFGCVDGQMSVFRGRERHCGYQQQERNAKDEAKTARIHDDSKGEYRESRILAAIDGNEKVV